MGVRIGVTGCEGLGVESLRWIFGCQVVSITLNPKPLNRVIGVGS